MQESMKKCPISGSVQEPGKGREGQEPPAQEDSRPATAFRGNPKRPTEMRAEPADAMGLTTPSNQCETEQLNADLNQRGNARAVRSGAHSEDAIHRM